MGKVKSKLLSDAGCVLCDTLYPRERAALGYQTCMQCGDALAKRIAAKQHTILPLHKQGYMAFTGTDAREVAKQINPKRTT